ncbi:hypothetical protein AK830_g9778 [Neonectria ditissima]|uniref:Uncharacterized protein n=1 Tax=Neonectria ditissima TaxID=78410 RepID=A0A0P7AH93_9HYPO|nr:hypothetical protein AK830_g9778 [Neonectria ditissima]
MQLTLTALTLGSLATLASANALFNASARRSFEFPESVPMHKRAVTGAAYECHANCGYTILDAEDEGYCDSDEWNELYEACLACATEYDLWPDYGDGVEAAAEGCGLSAVPAGADSTTAAETTAVAAETTAVVEETTAAAEATAVAETSVAVVETSSAAVETTVVEETSAVPTTSAVSESAVTTPSVVTTHASNSTSSTPTSTVVEGGAPEFVASHILVAAVALIAVAGLM